MGDTGLEPSWDGALYTGGEPASDVVTGALLAGEVSTLTTGVEVVWTTVEPAGQLVTSGPHDVRVWTAVLQ